jgi:hypothetical protein
VSLSYHLVIHAANVLAANQPTVQVPPGADKIDKVLGWGMWVVTALGVAGFMIVGGMMMVSHHQGRNSGGEHGSRFAWVAAGCVVAAAAGPIATAMGL